MNYFLAIDQGTSSSRTILFSGQLEIVDSSQVEYDCIFPELGWVEQDPYVILETQVKSIHEVLLKNKELVHNITAVGFTNQRESFVLWDSRTGKPVFNSINWQDKRSDKYCNELKNSTYAIEIREKTGLIIDSYFSATKVKWVIENVPLANEVLNAGFLMFGTIDTWLLWNLSGGRSYYTDTSNASRTMLFNINSLKWDYQLLDFFGLDKLILPEVKNTIDDFGFVAIRDFDDLQFPVKVLIGDQQAALFAQDCLNEGDVKITFGTGCFALLNAGSKISCKPDGIVTTVAWSINKDITYALEGSAFTAGSMIKWLKDALNLFDDYKELENILTKDRITDLYVIPAFVGLGSPFWNSEVKASIFGLDFSTTKEDIIYASLLSIALQSETIIRAMRKGVQVPISVIKVDGGLTSSNSFLQLLANITKTSILRSNTVEATALGVAKLLHFQFAGHNLDISSTQAIVTPNSSLSDPDVLINNYNLAIQKAIDFSSQKSNLWNSLV